MFIASAHGIVLSSCFVLLHFKNFWCPKIVFRSAILEIADGIHRNFIRSVLGEGPGVRSIQNVLLKKVSSHS